MIELLTSPEAWAALLTLTALEIVLGIDNVIFLSVIVSRIPRAAGEARAPDRACAGAGVPHPPAQPAGLADRPDRAGVHREEASRFSWRDIILIGGGLFLIAKATHEIHAEVEARDGEDDEQRRRPARSSG